MESTSNDALLILQKDNLDHCLTHIKEELDFEPEDRQNGGTNASSTSIVEDKKVRVVPSGTENSDFLVPQRDRLDGHIVDVKEEMEVDEVQNDRSSAFSASKVENEDVGDIKTPIYLIPTGHDSVMSKKRKRKNSETDYKLELQQMSPTTQGNGIDSKENIPYPKRTRCFKRKQSYSNVHGFGDDFIPLSVDGSLYEDGDKIYVGKLSSDTDENSLRDYFKRFGVVKKVQVKTKKSWNYAFVTFDESSSADSVMECDPHIIDGKSVIVGRSRGRRQSFVMPRTFELQKAKLVRIRSKRIFVGGIDPSLTTGSDVRNYFESFGRVVRVEHTFGIKMKRFCFVAFENEETVDRVCKKCMHVISGSKCRVKRAKDKFDPRNPPRNDGESVTKLLLKGRFGDGQSVGQSSESACVELSVIASGEKSGQFQGKIDLDSCKGGIVKCSGLAPEHGKRFTHPYSPFVCTIL